MKTTPPSAHTAWSAHFEALDLVRRSADTTPARQGLWLLAILPVFGLVWTYAGFGNAMYALVACGFAFVALAYRRTLPAATAQNESATRSRTREIERDLLQRVAHSIAPWWFVQRSTPITAHLVHESRVLREPVDFITGERCVTGVYGGRTPFSAMYLEAGQVQIIRRRQEIERRVITTGFRGLVVFIDHAPTTGWVTLHPQRSVAVAAVLNAMPFTDDPQLIESGDPRLDGEFDIRASSRQDARESITPALIERIMHLRAAYPDAPMSVSITSNAVAVAIPMRDNPLEFGDNAEVWPAELQHFCETLATLEAVLATFAPSHDLHHKAVA